MVTYGGFHSDCKYTHFSRHKIFGHSESPIIHAPFCPSLLFQKSAAYGKNTKQTIAMYFLYTNMPIPQFTSMSVSPM